VTAGLEATAHDPASAALQAVQRASAAQKLWSRRAPEERASRMRRLRAALLSRIDDVIEAANRDVGKPRTEGLMHEVVLTASLLRFLEREMPRVLRSRRVATWPFLHKSAVVRQEPYGVIGVISPANFPFFLAALPTLSALAAGNAVVLKPSERAPLTGRLLESIVREAMPEHPDLLMLLEGGAEEGEALIRSGVQKLVFIGGGSTGRRVAAVAAGELIPCVLELGANDVAIVRADADLERAAAGIVWAATANTGQVCMSMQRALVHADVYDEFVARAEVEMRRIRTPDDIGHLGAGGQLEVIERIVSDARSRGARVLVGGATLSIEPPIYPPTLIVDAGEECALHREEIFGPVLAVTPVADDGEALRLTESSSFGLSASIWSADAARARALARALRCGAVVINDVLANMGLAVPYGGVGSSGYGRLLGEEGLREFVRPKSIVGTRASLQREPYWYPYDVKRFRQLHRLVRATYDVGFMKRLRTVFGRG
jgi:succinate-semialdehyde dehydrogenase / glutarate-semialdehyde dehydrogenase